MNDKTIRAAMAGDQEAQRRCTEAGVALPCPFCGDGRVSQRVYHAGPMSYACAGCYAKTGQCSEQQQALAAWNTRAALPAETNPPSLQ